LHTVQRSINITLSHHYADARPPRPTSMRELLLGHGRKSTLPGGTRNMGTQYAMGMGTKRAQNGHEKGGGALPTS